MIDPKTLGTLIQNSYESAAELLREASRHLEDAAGAAEAGELDRARGVALPAEVMIEKAADLLRAVSMLRELGR